MRSIQVESQEVDVLELRRRSFLDAVDCLQKGIPLVGTFGRVDEARLRGWGVLALPLESVDAAIFAYGEQRDTCAVINATRIYWETKKCPILYVARGFITDGSCPAMDAFLHSTGKPVFSNGSLKSSLFSDCTWNQERYEEANEILAAIHTLYLARIEEGMSEEVLRLFLYAEYITNLFDRHAFLQAQLARLPKVQGGKRRVTCPRGILRKTNDGICYTAHPDQGVDIAPSGCCFGPGEERDYPA